MIIFIKYNPLPCLKSLTTRMLLSTFAPIAEPLCKILKSLKDNVEMSVWTLYSNRFGHAETSDVKLFLLI